MPVLPGNAGSVIIEKAPAAIDADGANGQHGRPAAYALNDKGAEFLANGGMKMEGQRVVCAHSWARDIVICQRTDLGLQPRIFPHGIIASKTAYKIKGKDEADPFAYLDAMTVPYIAVPPVIIRRTVGAVMGCLVAVTFKGVTRKAMVGDIGPGDQFGEVSVALADHLGIPSSPRTGGVSDWLLHYEIFPGVPSGVEDDEGKPFPLITSKGVYL